MRRLSRSREVGTRSGAGPGGDRAGRPDGVQRLRHRLRRDVGGAPPGAERRRRRRRWPARSRWGSCDMDNQALARQSAIDVAAQNGVWGAGAGHHAGRRHVPGVPAGSPGAGSNACIRVDVFRNQRAGGNPLPTFFGRLVGITQQGVRATATARGAVRRLHRLRQAVRDCRQVAGAAQRPGADRVERGRHLRTLRAERQQPRGTAGPGRLLRGAGRAGRHLRAQRHRVHPRVHGARRRRLRPPHHPEGRQPEPGDRSGLVPPGGHQSDRGSRRQQLPGQHRHLRPDGDRTGHRAADRARQHDRADEPGHSAT